MTVYVHPPVDYGRDFNAFTRRTGRSAWSHMATDGPVSELDTLAAKIGLRWEWRQGRSPRDFHYDLTPAMVRRAVGAGAVMVDANELARRCWMPHVQAWRAGRAQAMARQVAAHNEARERDG